MHDEPLAADPLAADPVPKKKRGKTTWHPLIDRHGRRWLLDDGTILPEPLLHISGSGLRVWAQVQDVKGYHRDADMVAFTAALKVASSRGRHIVCEEHTEESLLEQVRVVTGLRLRPAMQQFHAAYSTHFSTEAVSKEEMESSTATATYTTWRHPKLPIFFVTVNLIEGDVSGEGLSTIPSNRMLEIPHKMIWSMPLVPDLWHDKYQVPEGLVAPPDRRVLVKDLHLPTSTPGRYQRFGWMRTNGHITPPTLGSVLGGLLGTTGFSGNTEITSILEPQGRETQMKKKIWNWYLGMRYDRDSDTLIIPDVITMFTDIDGTAPLVLELRKVYSTVSDAVLEQVESYLSGTDHAPNILEAWKQLRVALGQAGIVLASPDNAPSDSSVTSREVNTSLLALVSGNRGAGIFQVTTRNADAGERREHKHHVLVDIVTGELSVTCPAMATGRMKEAVQEYSDLHTIATLTGKGDEIVRDIEAARERKVIQSLLNRVKMAYQELSDTIQTAFDRIPAAQAGANQADETTQADEE